MRGLEIGIWVLCIALSLPIIAVLIPGYNTGAGLDTGGLDTSSLNAFNMTSLEKYKPAENSNPIVAVVEQGNYFFQLAVMSLFGIGQIVWSIPGLVIGMFAMFNINATLTAALLCGFGIVILLTWLQIIKGDDWSGRR